jgi:hypothetical protein
VTGRRVALPPSGGRFIEPIILPNGRKLVTLRDAATYITRLPKAEHDAEAWQTAMKTLLLVAESDGPEMMARIGMMLALNRHEAKPMPAPRRMRQGLPGHSLIAPPLQFCETTAAVTLACPRLRAMT